MGGSGGSAPGGGATPLALLIPTPLAEAGGTLVALEVEGDDEGAGEGAAEARGSARPNARVELADQTAAAADGRTSLRQGCCWGDSSDGPEDEASRR